ncbi:MAG: histidinol-phosphatase [Clostridia bacterium]|nr:histidinol-phosphatase [Clostridia bacterium]
MRVNYHTHTVRCGHAEGEDREYVEMAISRGLNVLGFSDHVPMPFPDGHESHHRVPIARLEDYVSSVLSLRKEYAREIEILLGFEVEYYPDLFERMRELLRPYPVDYFLLGQHYNDSGERIYNTIPQSDEAALAGYTDRCIEAMRTGCFSYLAHPDLFCFTGDPSAYAREAARLCESAKALDVPLELNLLGFRDHRTYPSERFWKIAGEMQCRTVLGCDAHTPNDLAAPNNLREAAAFAERFGIIPDQEIALRGPF